LKGDVTMDNYTRIPNHDFYIKNIAHVLRYQIDQKLVYYHVTEPQVRLLGHIQGGQKAGHEISRKYLSEAMQISGPSVTSLLNSLEKNEFIIRSSGIKDGRTMQLVLTEKAIDVMKDTMNMLNEISDALLAGFSEGERSLFLGFLERVYENVGQGSHI
jgi:MarR family transcriptional regulator, repressor for mepA